MMSRLIAASFSDIPARSRALAVNQYFLSAAKNKRLKERDCCLVNDKVLSFSSRVCQTS